MVKTICAWATACLARMLILSISPVPRLMSFRLPFWVVLGSVVTVAPVTASASLLPDVAQPTGINPGNKKRNGNQAGVFLISNASSY